MGRDLKFRPGSWYRQDDRTGFVQRAERTRKEWNNLIVDRSVWEARQPQDLVRGVPDYQSVPDARPLPPNQFVGPQSEELSADAPLGSFLLPLQSLSGIRLGDKIGVMLATGEYFFTWSLCFITGALAILLPLPNDAPNGNVITDFGPNDDPLTSGFQVEEQGVPLLLESGAGYLGLEG